MLTRHTLGQESGQAVLPFASLVTLVDLQISEESSLILPPPNLFPDPFGDTQPGAVRVFYYPCPMLG